MIDTSAETAQNNKVLESIRERTAGLSEEARNKAVAGEIYRLEKRLLSSIGRAVWDFDLIRPGDKILSAVSGGKDSLVLLTLLKKLQERAPIKFSLLAMNIDLGQPGFDAAPIRAYVESLGVEHNFIVQDVYSIAKSKAAPGKSLCPICSRLRRGILYTQAIRLGCGKIALGHHREDLVETLLLSAFYAGALKSMPPILRADDGQNTIIRPMAYCPEEEIEAYASLCKMPVAPKPPCETPDLQRSKIKALIRSVSKGHPAVPGNLLNALCHVVPTHLLDKNLMKLSQAGAPAGINAAASYPTEENQTFQPSRAPLIFRPDGTEGIPLIPHLDNLSSR